jgi:hypothetical protein
MSTTKTNTQGYSIDAESIDLLFTCAYDEVTQPTPPPKPVVTIITKRTRKQFEPIAFQPHAMAYISYSDTSPDEPSDWWTTGRRYFAVLCFIVGIGMLVKPYFGSPNTTHKALTAVAASSSQPQVTNRNIEDCELGQRALGKNPLRDQVETLPEPDPETSRAISLTMRKESGHRLDIRLIRSLSWIESVGAIEGKSFYLNMEEMGAVGDAYVEAILPCPAIQKGDGNVITGIFAHEADPGTRILSVTFSDEECIEGVTDNHSFWSVNHNNFVSIGDMKEGDWVKTASGLTQIIKLDSRFAQSGEILYNLETHNEHVFQVTLAGILVHNSCADITFGVHENLDDFTLSIRTQFGKNVESFPFMSLTKKSDGAWQGIRRAMDDVNNIHFNMKGMTKENFQRWMNKGGHLSEPGFNQAGWTNKELYEILSDRSRRAKTKFYNLVGDIDEWLVKP